MTDVRDVLRRADDVAPPELWPEIRRRASRPGDPPPRLEASRTSRLISAVIALLIFVAGGSLSARLFLGDDRSSPARPDPWASVGPGWSRLPDPPFRRSGPAAVWTGSELLLWGGTEDFEARFFDDGAAFDPSTETWRSLAPAPISPRSDPHVAWTGSEVLIVGGYTARGHIADGARYHPEADTWRPIAPPPFELATPAASSWTGDRFLLWGSHVRDQGETRGLLYDPARNAWKPTAEAPLALNLASAVWTGREVIVYGSELNNRNISSTRWAQGMAYDPAQDTWRVLPERHISPQASWASWTGTEMLVWDYETSSALYDPVSGSWREPNPMPLRFSECYPFGVATTAIVFASFCAQAATFDIAADAWAEVRGGPYGEPTAPRAGAVPVAAGDVVLVFHASEEDNEELAGMWAYRSA